MLSYFKAFWEFADQYHDAILAMATLATSLIVLHSNALNIKISKANRLCENRVRWIEELRKEVAELVTNFSRLAQLEHDKIIGDFSEKDADELDGLYPAASLLFNRIKLRLNVEESSHLELVRTLNKFFVVSSKFNSIDDFEKNMSLMNKHKRTIFVLTQRVLKEEWNKAKDGK